MSPPPAGPGNESGDVGGPEPSASGGTAAATTGGTSDDRPTPDITPESRLTRVAMLLPVIGAPAGLCFAIFASLMISGWRVQHSAIVQVDSQWRPGERVAMRVHVQDGDGSAVEGASVDASLVRGEQSVSLGALTDATGGGATQATVQAPDWPPGPAELALAIRGPGHEFRERVPITLESTRAARRGTLTISTSTKNWSDDTEPQPEALRITLRPLGRLAAGFENTLLVRVTDPEGHPQVAEIEVRLLDGDFEPRPLITDQPTGAKIVARGSTDAQGLLRFDGQLSTDVVRFEVVVARPPAPAPCGKCAAEASAAGKDVGEGGAKPAATSADKDAAASVVAPEPAPGPLGARKFRLVSFAGAVRVSAEPLALRAGEPLTIHARALRAKKAVFVDVHGPDGAWLDTLAPVTGPEPPREWSTVGVAPGFLQVEAYQFTTSPGESAALARVQVTTGAPDSDAALGPLFEQQRALLDVGRVEKGYDRELERKYLDAIERLEVAAADVPLARAWLLGTLPIEVLGPPLALTTLPREQADLLARKQAWANGLRWFLLGGGGAFLLLTLLLIVISHRRAAAKLTGEIHGAGATAAIAHEIAQAQRAVLLRAVALVVTMAMGLVLTVVVLDKLLWSA